MKLVSYKKDNRECLGIWHDGNIYNLRDNSHALGNKMMPSTMGEWLKAGEAVQAASREINGVITSGSQESKNLLIPESQEISGSLLAPVPHPTSCRDGYAFRQHVESARRNRKVPMIPEFDQYPIFYFTNHLSVQGPGDVSCMPDHFQKLDFELETAIVIGKEGRNIRAAEADQYIAGYMIMNDMSARALQMEEMLLNLGPAKGKDFSTVIGPWMVTPDELEPYRTEAMPGHTGNAYKLAMKCLVNGKLVSSGNMADMNWTFAELIERSSYGVTLLPGDVIGSGTVGTGCFLELNGTGLLNDPQYPVQWLQPNDTIEMEVEGLGILFNRIVAEKTDYSIMKLKKMQPA